MNALLLPGGMVTLVIMPRICLWEILLALKGNFRTAFRRFKKNGSISHLEGEFFRTYYYSPKYIQRAFGTGFKIIALQGLGTCCPPPYLENFPKRFPNFFRRLVALDERFSSSRFFRNCADHFIITLQKAG